MTVEPSDCCGNGCVNCILDVQPKEREHITLLGKKNIILNYTKFKLLNKKHHNEKSENVIEMHFVIAEPQTADYVLDVPAGYHVMMRATMRNAAGESETILRPYSPFWVDAIKLEFKILVNLKVNGPMSQFITNMTTDDVVEFRGPIGTYVHSPEVPKHICIVSQGVAVAPTIPIVEQVLFNEDDLSRIVHLICYTDMAHFYFRQLLQDFNKYWNYKSSVYLSHAQCGSEECKRNGGCTNECAQFRSELKYKEAVFAQRLTEQDLRRVLEEDNAEGEKVVIASGSREFQNFVTKTINKLNIEIDDKNVYLL